MEIKNENGNYVLYISGELIGTYNTFNEAVKSYEKIMEGKAS